MKRIASIGLAGCLVVLILSGCDRQPKPPSAQPTPSASAAPTALLANPLTGSQSATAYKPVIAMIDNSQQARPQQGIQAADIMYECLVEGGITRLMGVWNSQVPDVIGPVRSTRQYFAAIASEYDPVFCYFGGPKEEAGDLNVYAYMEEHHLFQAALDGMSETLTYYRSSERVAPHNAMLYTEKALERMTFSPTPRTFSFQPAVTYEKAGTKVSLGFGGQLAYTYDPEKGAYVRSVDGEAYTDSQTNGQVTASNLIFQWVSYHTKEEGRQQVDLAGQTGDICYFANGTYQTGTWRKESVSAPTQYQDEQGQEIQLQPGNTWIHLIPAGTALDIE